MNIAEKEKRIDILAETYRILAISYRDQQELGKAVSYIRQAEQLALQHKNWDLLARVYNLAGVIDCTRELDDSALIFYNKSLKVTEEHAISTFHVGQVLSNIGEIYLGDNPDKALDYFTRALASAKETRNKSAEAGIVADIGRAYILKKNFVYADRFLQQSLKLSRDLGLKRVSRHAYLALVDLRLQQGNVKEAFDYMDFLKERIQADRFYNFTIPITAIYTSDDYIANDKSASLMMQFFPNAPCELIKLEVRKYTPHRVGHIGIFRKRFELALWPWLLHTIHG